MHNSLSIANLNTRLQIEIHVTERWHIFSCSVCIFRFTAQILRNCDVIFTCKVNYRMLPLFFKSPVLHEQIQCIDIKEIVTGQLGMTLNYPMAIKNCSATCSVMGRGPLNKHKNALSGCRSVTSQATDVILPTYTLKSLILTDSHSNNSMTTTHSNYIFLVSIQKWCQNNKFFLLTLHVK